MIIVFLKSTVTPLLSVKRPSSRSCNIKFKISKCAFSISSNKTTWKGLKRTDSVSRPPASNPGVPGGGPIILATEVRSMYSLMSRRRSAVSSLNIKSAKDFANSVLPTPVVPIKRNDPIGLFGS